MSQDIKETIIKSSIQYRVANVSLTGVWLEAGVGE